MKKVIVIAATVLGISSICIPTYGVTVETVEKSQHKQAGTSSNQYSSGQYKVGTDIPSGEYVLFASDGKGYFCLSSDGNADDIIVNDNFEYDSILTINDGEYLNLTRCYAIPITEDPAVETTQTGMFLVGKHIPAGEYKLDAGSDSGYYCIYSSSRQDNIVSNDNFEGQRYVTVSAGQYLLLSRCKFVDSSQTPEVTITDSETIKKVQELLNASGYSCGEADGVAGQNTSNAIIQYKSDNHMNDTTPEITQELLEQLEVVNTNSDDNIVPENMEIGEENWKNWESSSKCTVIPFLGAAKKAGFDISLPSGQEENDKVGTLYFLDENGYTGEALEGANIYYGTKEQKIIYAGLETSNSSVYESEDFREACIRLVLGYNMHFDSDSLEAVLNLSRERAEEIVNYCLSNNVDFCVVDNMRIHVICRNDDNDPHYRFHVEY